MRAMGNRDASAMGLAESVARCCEARLWQHVPVSSLRRFWMPTEGCRAMLDENLGGGVSMRVVAC